MIVVTKEMINILWFKMATVVDTTPLRGGKVLENR